MSGKLIINVNEGKVRGIKESSTFSKKEYYSFYGIPYAEPTSGNSRFKDPIKVKPWKNIHDATKEKPGCIQFSPLTFEFCGTEDCLFNNIHIPQAPQKDEPLKSVIINIHPGAFHHGSPHPRHFGSPDFVMHHDIVYVGIAYRLHVLGFLNLGLEDCSGNEALKDIIMSLQWIRNNIASFGGDPENITLLGNSSGATLIHALMLSPASKGLFHKAVLMSGYLMNPIAPFQVTNKLHAVELVKLLGYKKDFTNYEKILKFLKTQRSMPLYQGQAFYQNELKKTENIAPITTIGTFAITNDPIILPHPPVKLIESMMRIPIVIGFSERESIFGFIRGPEFIQKTEENFATTFCQNPWGWGYNLTEEEIELIQKKVESYYNDGQPIAQASLSVKVDIHTDIIMSDVYDTVINPLAAELPSSVFVYKFEFEGNIMSLKGLDLLEKLKGLPTLAKTGTYHGTEFCYCHRFSDPGDLETHQMVHEFTKLIATFAKTGDPNHEDLETQWRSSTPENPCYFRINSRMDLVEGKLNNNRLEFWQGIKKQFKRDISSRIRS